MRGRGEGRRWAGAPGEEEAVAALLAAADEWLAALDRGGRGDVWRARALDELALLADELCGQLVRTAVFGGARRGRSATWTAVAAVFGRSRPTVTERFGR